MYIICMQRGYLRPAVVVLESKVIFREVKQGYQFEVFISYLLGIFQIISQDYDTYVFYGALVESSLIYSCILNNFNNFYLI